ncbi:hypothetical protein E5288_WYG021339 [Bos mutus]|uniref:Uncharacterized protein n=1 Tax=Bos mutus TaxID=72004 RepID=A0A6B0RDS8_9CETA|nr:hypothetical protein [Bos mutus]
MYSLNLTLNTYVQSTSDTVRVLKGNAGPSAAREPGRRVRGRDAAAAPPQRALAAPEPSGRGTSRAARATGILFPC